MLKKSFLPRSFLFFFITLLFTNLSCSDASDAADSAELKKAGRDYCQRYGEILASKPSLKLNEPSKVVIQSLGSGSWGESLLFKLGNFVTPPKSKIVNVLRCKFEIQADNNASTDVSIDILIFKTKSEAQYHAEGGWKNIQLIDVETFYSEKDKKDYYIIVKYLKINGRQISRSETL